MLKQNHLTRNHYLLITRPVHQLLKQRVADDIGVHEVAPTRLANIDSMELFLFLFFGGGGTAFFVGGDAAVAAAELGE